MSKLDAKEMLKGFNIIKRQINNLMTQTLTPEIMASLNDEQLEQVKGIKKDLKSLDRKGLNKDSEIFKKFN